MSTISSPSSPADRALRALCGGAVHLPGEEGYVAACAQVTGGAPPLAPAAVMYPANETEVAETLLHLGRAGLRVLVQRTNLGPMPVDDLGGVVLLRTSGLGGVSLDEDTGDIRARAGALWSDVVSLAAAHDLPVDPPHELARGVVGGSVLPGSSGLPAARVVAARAVLADGGILSVLDRSHRLLTGLRAGLLPAAVVTELTLASAAGLPDELRSPERAALRRAVRDELDPHGIFVLPPVPAD